ncbi:MAG: FtsQ-type POTRA domain-containing protein [Candidatus Omnitrophota bacterium]
MKNFFARLADSFAGLIRYLCRVVLLGATLAGLILIAFDLACYFFDSSDFTVQQITIEGNERVGEAEIIAQAGIAPGANIWLVDMETLGRRLENHPAIRRVSVQRVPPKRIHIVIEERYPVAFLLNAETGLLHGVDEDGFILPPCFDRSYNRKTLTEQQADIRLVLSSPLLSGRIPKTFAIGEQLNDLQIRGGLRFLKQLHGGAQEFFAEIAEAEWREDENFVLHPRRRIGVMVLRDLLSPDLDKKISAFWKALTKENLRAIYVDARFPEKGFAVRFDESEGLQWKRLYQPDGRYLTGIERRNG